MNEKAFQDAYQLFIENGYTKSSDDFRKLINENPQALNDSYEIFKTGGYSKSIDEYKTLLGVGVEEPGFIQSAITKVKSLFSSDEEDVKKKDQLDSTELPSAGVSSDLSSKPTTDLEIAKAKAQGKYIAPTGTLQEQVKAAGQAAIQSKPEPSLGLSSRSNFESILNSINETSLGEDEDDIEDNLSKKLKPLGVTVSQDKAFREAIKLSVGEEGKPGYKEISVPVDNFFSKNDKKSAIDLKKWLAENTNQERIAEQEAVAREFERATVNEEGFKKALGGINADLISKDKESIVPQLTAMFGNYGIGDKKFQFEEVGITDNIKVTAPNGKVFVTEVDAFTTKGDEKIAADLKKFMDENKPVLLKAEDNLNKYATTFLSEKEMEDATKSFSIEADNFKNEVNSALYEKKILESGKGKMSPDEYNQRTQALNKKIADISAKEGQLNSNKLMLDKSLAKYVDWKSEQGGVVSSIVSDLIGGIANIGGGAMTAFSDAMIGIAPVEFSVGSQDYRRKFLESSFEAGVEVPYDIMDLNQFKISDANEVKFNKWLESLPEDVREKVDDKIKDNTKKRIKKDVLSPAMGIIGKGYRELVGTSPEYIEKAQKTTALQSGFMGVAGSLPAMTGGKYVTIAQFALMGLNGTMNEMSGEGFEDISENEKYLVAVPVAILNGVLEEYGLRNMIGKSSVTTSILSSVMGKAGKKATASTFKELVENEVESRVARGLLTLGAAGLAEAETGGMQQLGELAIKEIYNQAKEKELFQTPNGISGWVDEIGESARQEAVGGMIMGSIGAVSTAASANNYNGISDKTLRKLELLRDDETIRSAFVANLKYEIASGKKTNEQAEAELDGYNKSISIYNQIPSDITDAAKRKAFGLLAEKADLELKIQGKDESLTKKDKERIVEIKNELSKLPEMKEEGAAPEAQPAKPKTLDEIQDEEVKSNLQYLLNNEEGDLISEEEYIAKKQEARKAKGILGRITSPKPSTRYLDSVKSRIEMLKNNPEQFLKDEISKYEKYKEEEGEEFNSQGYLDQLTDLQSKLQQENAIQKSTTEEGVLRTEQPKLELPKMGEGNAQETITQEGVTPAKQEEVVTALSNVESTTKALEGIGLTTKIPASSEYKRSQPKEVSEAYHKAKADGSNPKLVKAVEDLLGKPTESKAQAGSGGVGGEVKFEEREIPIDKIQPVNKDGQTLEDAKINVADKMGSRTEGKILVYENADGTYEVGDGFHRIAEAISRGDKTIKADVKLQSLKEQLKTEAKPIEQEVGELEQMFPTEGPTGENRGVAASNTQAMDEIASRATDERVQKTIKTAQRLMKTLRSLVPTANIYLHETDESYNGAMEQLNANKNSDGHFVMGRNADGKSVVRIDINLSRATPVVVAHEVAHVVLQEAFGDNQKLFQSFQEKIAKVLSTESNQQLLDFANQDAYKEGGVTYEEYMVQLKALLSEQGTKLKLSTAKKIAAVINEYVSRITKGAFKPFQEVTDVKQVIDFVNKVTEAMAKGEAIEVEGISKIGEGTISRSSIKNIDVNKIRTLSRAGNRVSKGLSIKDVKKQKIVEEAEDLSLEYVKEKAPELFVKNANLISKYPIVQGIKKFGEIKNMKDAEEVYDIFTRQIADNLKYLMDNFKKEFRDIATLWYDGANILAQNFSKKYGISTEQAAGIMASLSPQKDWYQNVRLAEMVMMAFKENPVMTQEMVEKQREIAEIGLEEYTKDLNKAKLAYKKSRSKANAEKLQKEIKSNAKYIEKTERVLEKLSTFVGTKMSSAPPEMKAYYVRLFHEINTTKDYNVLSPDGNIIGIAKKKNGSNAQVAWGSYGEIGKAVSIYLDGSQGNITRTLGEMHKIRNFYNNIIDPMSPDRDVTMDTHAVAAALLLPLSGKTKEVKANFGTGTSNSAPLGIKGLYYAFAEGYNLAAKEVGLLPRQVQSITWEAVRGLFTDKFKLNKANIAGINQIVENYVNKQITLDEARNQITEYAGGIKDPSWAGGPLQEESTDDAETGADGRGSKKDGPDTVGTKRRGQGRVISRSSLREREITMPDGTKETVKPVSPMIVDGFYSPLEKSILNLKALKWGSGEQVLNELKKAGAKPDELKWTGMEEWLSQQGKVSKDDILNFLDENRVEILEVVKADKSVAERRDELIDFQNQLEEQGDYAGMEAIERQIQDLSDDSMGKEATKHSKWQLEGEKENYKEVLVTLPNQNVQKKELELANFKKELVKKYGDNFKGSQLTDNEIDKLQQLKSDAIKSDTKFKSTHFDEPNILVHLRMNTRTAADGSKVLFLEEVQSDWGQKGREEGFGESERLKKSRVTLSEAKNSLDKAKEKLSKANKNGTEYDKKYEADSVKKWEEIVKQQEEQVKFAENTNRDNTPTAPFVTDTKAWTTLGLKVALKEAIKQGADRIAWTTGEQQNDRYDLSKQVDEITYRKLENGDYIIVVYKDGQAFNRSELKESQLEASFGKEVADKIINDKGQTNKDSGVKSLSGIDLKVGGKGMKVFYGSPTEGSLGIVGNAAKNLFKQQPGTVEIKSSRISKEADVFSKFITRMADKYGEVGWVAKLNEAEKKEYQEVATFKTPKQLLSQHSIDITPELKQKVETEGLPLFSRSSLRTAEQVDKMVKDARASGYSEKAIEEFLKKRGVDQAIIDKSLGKKEAGTKIVTNEEMMPGYDKMMEDVNTKILDGLNRNAKQETILSNVMKIVEGSEAYKNATDQQKEEITREVKKAFGEKMKSSPSAKKVLGLKENIKQITMALSKYHQQRYEDMEKAEANKEKAIKNASKELVASLKGLVRKGQISTRQMAAVLRKFVKTNVLSKSSVKEFTDYMSKVFADADYANKLSEARTLRKIISKASKNKSFSYDANLVKLAVEFKKIDPSMVEDLDQYNKMASQLKEAIKGSKAIGAKVKFANTVKISEFNDYVEATLESQKEKIIEELRQQVQDLLGIDASTLSYQELIDKLNETGEVDLSKENEEAVRVAVGDMFKVYSDAINSMLLSDVDIKESKIELVKRFMKMDISKMKIKDAIYAVDALNNFMVNGSTAKMEKVLNEYEGQQVGDVLLKKKIKADVPKIYRTEWGAQRIIRYFQTVPMMIENFFKGAKAQIFERETGIRDLISHKSQAQRIVNVILKDYTDIFYKLKPNNQAFNTAFNNIERNMLAFVTRAKIGKEAESFKDRKSLIEQSIKNLKSGTEAKQKKAELYQQVYDKILKDSKNAQEVMDKVDPINVKSFNYWVDVWSNYYEDLADVSENIHNKILGKDMFYTPDKVSKLDPEEQDELGEDMTASAFHTNSGVVYKKKTGRLEESTLKNKLPEGSYIDLSFDSNNANLLLDALVDIKTAGDVAKLNAFLKSDSFKKVFPNAEIRKVFVSRMNTMVRNFRNKNHFQDNEARALSRFINRIGGLSSAIALTSGFQLLKQTVSVGGNTLINAGIPHFGYRLNKAKFDFINNSGEGIANRGTESQADINAVDSLISQAAESTGEKALQFIEKANKIYLGMVLKHPDIWIAKASWLAYYEKGLRRQGIKTKNLDYSDHKMNKEAAQYAQRMVDRQQNISDADLKGEFFSSKSTGNVLLSKILFPLASFRINAWSRMNLDLRTIANKTASLQDRKDSIRSLIGGVAESVIFNAIGIWSTGTMYGWAMDAIRGADDDDEDKEKQRERDEKYADSILKGRFSQFTNDLFSPLPITDWLAETAIFETLDLIQELNGVKEDERLNIFEPPDIDEPQKMTKYLGAFGISLERLNESKKIIQAAVTGKIKDKKFGQETVKYVDPKDKEVLSTIAKIAVLNGLGLLPADANSLQRNIFREINKQASTKTEAEITREKSKKREQRSDNVEKLEIIDQAINEAEDQDVVDELMKIKRETRDKLSPKKMSDEAKEVLEKKKIREEAQYKDLLGGYDTRSDLERYDPDLYEENFGEGTEYYETHKAEVDAKKFYRKIEKQYKDEKYGYEEPLNKKRRKREKNSDGTYKKSSYRYSSN